MLLDQPMVLAVDARWKQFVRMVGNLGVRYPGSVDGDADQWGCWSSRDWQHDLENLTNLLPAPDSKAVAAHPPTDHEPVPEVSDNPDQRRLRAAILRAQMLSRQGRFIEAEAAFSEAMALDPELDLARYPTFWELERGGQESAVRALQGAGRSREAMVLRARLENRYRPRLVRSA